MMGTREERSFCKPAWARRRELFHRRWNGTTAYNCYVFPH